MKKFEDLLEDLGGFNRFQFLIMFGLFSMKIVIGFSMLQMAFMGFVPDFQCIIDESPGPLTHTRTHALSAQNADLTRILSSRGKENLNVCHVNNTLCKSYLFFGPSRTIITEWNLVCNLLWVKATTISVQMGGVLVGALINGQLGDLIGRKKSLYGSFFLHGVLQLASAFSTSWQIYMVLRFLIGVGLGAMLVIIIPYPMEFLPLRWRATLPIIPMFPLGAGGFGVAAWYFNDWKKLHLLCAVMSIPNLFGWFYIPESFRWLTVKGRVKEAYKVVELIGKTNERQIPTYALDIIKTIAMEEKRCGEEKKYSYIDIFRGKRSFRCTILFSLIWCCFSMAFYGESFGVSSFGGNLYLNIVLINVLEIPVYILVFFINDRVGRRLAQSGLIFISALALFGCLFIYWTPPNQTGKTVSIYLSLAAKVFMSGAWSVSMAWVTEVYPTVTRNLGYGMANMAARIGGIIAPFAINLDENASLSYSLICFATVLSLVLTMFVPDTKNVALADSLIPEEESEGRTNSLTIIDAEERCNNDASNFNQEMKSLLEEEE